MKESHYIPAYTRINGRRQESACGRWIMPREHSNEPTCPFCVDYLHRDAETADMISASLSLVLQDGILAPEGWHR